MSIREVNNFLILIFTKLTTFTTTEHIFHQMVQKAIEHIVICLILCEVRFAMTLDTLKV